MRNRLMYIAWKLRGNRLVRLHLANNEPTVEGVLVSSKGGHYLLLAPKLMPDNQESFNLQGTVRVPRERVLLIQEL